jgi:hypothetical protein
MHAIWRQTKELYAKSVLYKRNNLSCHGVLTNKPLFGDHTGDKKQQPQEKKLTMSNSNWTEVYINCQNKIH